MNLNSGQVVSLLDLRRAFVEGPKIQIGEELFSMGQAMEILFFNEHSNAVKFDCVIAAFELVAGEGTTPIVAVQIGSTDYYCTMRPGPGILAHPGQFTDTLIDELQQAHRQGGRAAVAARIHEAVPAAEPQPARRKRDNMDFGRTQAPASEVGMLKKPQPPAESSPPRRGHLRMVTSHETQTHHPDSQAPGVPAGSASP